MKIIVPVKHVPAEDVPITIQEKPLQAVPAEDRWIMNPYDELAVEEGLRITERLDGVVTVLSAGSELCLEVIEQSLAMGADRGVFLHNDLDMPLEVLDVARILAGAISPMSYDMIITGHRSVDQDAHWVGPALAEYLQIPCIPMVIKQELRNGRIRCHQYLEKGYRVLETTLPALITSQQGLNIPRYVSLPGIKNAGNKPIEIIPISRLGLDESLLKHAVMPLSGFEVPEKRQHCRLLADGTPYEKASRLVRLLREDAVM